MLSLLGLLTVIALVSLIVGRVLSPLVALITVPVTAAGVGGFGLRTATFVVTGIQQIAPVATMFVFAILYFGIISDAGTLDPIRPHSSRRRVPAHASGDGVGPSRTALSFCPSCGHRART